MFETLTAIEFNVWLIPVVAALVGWVTNWLAIKLTFAPIEFVGVGSFLGWQGIIPSKVDKMSDVMVDSIMSKLGTMQEIFVAMEPDRISHQVLRVLKPQVDDYIDDIMERTDVVTWENMPLLVRNRIYARAHRALPKVVAGVMNEVAENTEKLIDLRAMIRKGLRKDKTILNRLFLECGEKEFRFIVLSGLFLGGFFGVIQMFIWQGFAQAWMLPFFGVLVGWATNWVALNLIFRPKDPIYFAGIKIQGMFLRRQQEVTKVYSRLVTQEVLTVSNILEELVHGERKERTKLMLRKHVYPHVDGAFVKFFLQFSVGTKGFINMKSHLTDKIIEVISQPFEDEVFVNQRAEKVEHLFISKMNALAPEDYQALLRPAFEEDELKLIFIGALLGGVAGVIQYFLLFN